MNCFLLIEAAIAIEAQKKTHNSSNKQPYTTKGRKINKHNGKDA